jgi:hypothetical protein
MTEAGTLSMNRYLAEVYLTHVGEFEATTSPLVDAARAIRGEGTPVRHLRSIFVPEDQTCLLLFEAGSPATVQRVAERAELQVTRVVAAMETAIPGESVPDERIVAAEEIGVGRPAATEKGERR